jgi:hypothetical protein
MSLDEIAQYTEYSLLLPRPDDVPVSEVAKRDQSKAPDGGTTAWLQVLAGHLVVFNVWGYITS